MIDYMLICRDNANRYSSFHFFQLLAEIQNLLKAFNCQTKIMILVLLTLFSSSLLILPSCSLRKLILKF